MNGYAATARNSVMDIVVYRLSFLFTLLANVIVIVITWFLWTAIYSGSQTINGMDFTTAFATVALSTTFYTMFRTYLPDLMCRSIMDGSISQTLIKPVDYQLFLLAGQGGPLLLNFLIVALPSLALLVGVFHVTIPLGLNLAIFAVSMVLSFLLVFVIDFIVGLISFYTFASWGLSATKDFVVLLMSGALVPLNFFPDWLKHAADVLPFRAIFAIPMEILFAKNGELLPHLGALGVQALWLLGLGALSRLFYRKAIKVVTVQGG